MRILLIHRYFWPDSPPYASMLRVIGAHLVAQGHSVTVLTTRPSYTAETARLKVPKQEQLDGIRVIRKWMFPESKRNWIARLANAALLQVHVFLHIALQRRRYELVTASTMPPVIIGAVSCAATRLRGGRFLYHCMDLYPEVAEISGSRWLGRGPLRWLLARLDRRTCRKAWRVVVLSQDMQDTLLQRGCAAENLRVINNFALADDAPHSGSKQPVLVGGKADAFRVLFAGNIGRFQGLESVLQAAMQLPEDSPVELHFLGDGVARAELEARAGSALGKRIFFHGFQPLAHALRAMREADLGIVSLQAQVIRAAFPSKTMTYLAAGLPLLALVESDSSLAAMVREHKIGITVDHGQAESLASILSDFANDREEVLACKQRALRLAEAEFSAPAAMRKWDALFSDSETAPRADRKPAEGAAS